MVRLSLSEILEVSLTPLGFELCLACRMYMDISLRRDALVMSTRTVGNQCCVRPIPEIEIHGCVYCAK